MAGNTLTKSYTTQFFNGCDVSAYVQIRQPTAGSTSNCQINVSVTVQNSTIDSYVSILCTSSAISDWKNGGGLSFSPGDSTKSTGWKTVSGLNCNTGSTTFTVKLNVYNDDGQSTLYLGMLTGTLTGTVYWAQSVGTPGAPGAVRLGTSSSYSSNGTSNISRSAPSPGSFYITWTAGSAGTNNAISGYQRRVIYASSGNVVSGTAVTVSGTSTLYSNSTGWGSSAVGNTYKAQVQTLGAAGVNSTWTTSVNSVTFTASGTSYTNVGAPGGVRVGTSSSYASNTASNYNVGAPSPGAFYITWSAGSAGTNNAIAGYRRRVLRVSDSQIVSGTTKDLGIVYSDQSTSWLASAVGYSYKGQVMTLGSVSGLDSGYTQSSNTVTFTASSSSGHTLTANANGGSPNRTYTGTAFTHQSIESPTRENYGVSGWYFDSTASNCLDYGTSRAVTASNIKITFWTDATTYAQGGTASTICSIFSCAEGGGYTVCNENGNWEFQVHDGSSWKTAGIAASSVTPGYHEWCCIANVTAKKIYLYLDGTLKAQTSLTNAQISYNANYKKLLLGGELQGNGMKSNSGFVGKIGNFKLVYSSSTYSYSAPEYDVFDIPEQDATVYAYWKRTGYSVLVCPNGGTWGGTTSNTTISVTYGTNKSIAAPTKAGYEFVGWACKYGTINANFSDATGFFSSVPAKYVWGGSSYTNNSTLTSVTGTNLTSSINMLRITEPGTSARGVGFYRGITAQLNKVYLVVFSAKAPQGTYFAMTGNSIGSGSSYEWLTPVAGTGGFQTYACKVTSGTSGTVSNFGHLVVCGGPSSVAGTTNPGNIVADIEYFAIGYYDSIFNSATSYVPKSSATEDTIFALWIEKSYDIDYNLNGGTFSEGVDTIYPYTSTGVEALNPTLAQWNRSPYIVGLTPAGSGKPTGNSPGIWFRLSYPTKDPNISETTTAITTSFNAASAISPLTSTETVITSTPQNFYSWTITGMDSSTHHYWGRANASTTTHSNQSFTSTSITLVANTHFNGGGPPREFYNLRQSSGGVLFTAGWTPGTTTTTTEYTGIDLPTIPTKASEPSVTTVYRTISYDAGGGTCPITSTDLHRTSTTMYSSDKKWYTTSSYTTSVGNQGDSYAPTSSGTLYAKYTAKTATEDETWITLPTPTYDFKVFRGWYDSDNNFAGFGGDYYSPDSTKTLYAKWYNKYFVSIRSGDSIKKAIPYILKGGVWRPSKAYVNTTLNNTRSWYPSGKLPDDDGYTHVVIVDTQNFTIPNRDWDMDDDDGDISLTKSSEFTSRMTSHQDFVDFFSECKRIIVTIDGEVVEDITTLNDIAFEYGGGWFGYDYYFSTPVSGFFFQMYDYNENICNNGDWGSYKGGTHSIKIEALL